MRGPLDWGRWAPKQGELYGLSDPEVRVLQVLAGHVDREGVVKVEFLTHEVIGRLIARNGKPRSQRTVRRLLARLRAHGLVSWTQQGRRVPRYQLHDVLPVEQLSLDAPAARSEVTGRPTGQPANYLTGDPGQVGDRQERKEEVVVVAARASDDRSNDGLDPRLGEVLAIFEELPSPYCHLEPASIDAALRAYPDSDAVAAAHIVASKVHGRQAHTSHVNTLLLGVLRRMPKTTDGPAPAASSHTAGGGRSSARQPKPWDGALQRAMETST